MTPRNWFQFADDAIAISATEYENQTLVNAFSRWCNWAKMKIRPDKCQTFAMKKVLTQSKQFKPKIYVDSILIKSIEEKESFRYLGRWFNFDMDNSEHKRQLLDTKKSNSWLDSSVTVTSKKISFKYTIGTFSVKSVGISR